MWTQVSRVGCTIKFMTVCYYSIGTEKCYLTYTKISNVKIWRSCFNGAIRIKMQVFKNHRLFNFELNERKVCMSKKILHIHVMFKASRFFKIKILALDRKNAEFVTIV